MRYQSIANGKKLSIWEIDNFQFGELKKTEFTY